MKKKNSKLELERAWAMCSESAAPAAPAALPSSCSVASAVEVAPALANRSDGGDGAEGATDPECDDLFYSDSDARHLAQAAPIDDAPASADHGALEPVEPVEHVEVAVPDLAVDCRSQHVGAFDSLGRRNSNAVRMANDAARRQEKAVAVLDSLNLRRKQGVPSPHPLAIAVAVSSLEAWIVFVLLSSIHIPLCSNASLPPFQVGHAVCMSRTVVLLVSHRKRNGQLHRKPLVCVRTARGIAHAAGDGTET